MPTSGSPTVRRRRLAAELRKLRGNRKGGEVARAVGWSASKISRAESGHESLPPPEIEKLVDYYGVTEPLRGRLLELAEDAVQRSWWDDYADILDPQYLEFIGLEAEAASCRQWQSDVVPGLLQTEEYARRLNATFRTVDPLTPPSVRERFLRARMLRQERLTHEPALRLSVVIDEAVLLRGVGDREVMRDQLAHLVDAAELPNVKLRVLPLVGAGPMVAASFVILSFGFRETFESAGLADVVSTEGLITENYVEGETDTHLYTMFYAALEEAALSPAESRRLIRSTIDRT